MDGTHVPIVDCAYLVRTFLTQEDIAIFAHRKRKCVYQEMEACVDYNKAEAAIVKKQEDHYRAQGYPPNNGLAECTVILRRHNVPKVKNTMEDWWKEIDAYTLRDQLSFNYVAFRNHLTYAVMPGDVRYNHYFKFTPHVSLDKPALSVGWVLNGTPETASSRIMGYNVHEYLVSKGIYSKILYVPQARITSGVDLSLKEVGDILNFNINMLVIVKINTGLNLDYLIRCCKRRNIKVVYALCDWPSLKMVGQADGTIATSDHFYKIIPKKYRRKLFIAFDGYEQPSQLQKIHGQESNVKLCFVSNQVWDVFPCITKLPPNVQLKVIGPSQDILESSFKDSAVFRKSGFDFEYVIWKLETVYQEILGCDIGIIPWPKIGEQQKIKSVNRLVMFMALGMPVIASPIPSYLEIIKNGENGFIAKTAQEWEKYIVFLRDNSQEREKIGKKARETVLSRYSKEKQGELYLDIFNKILK